MPPLLFPLPSTNLLSLGGSTFIDPSGSHTTQLADATQARTKFQIALKAFTDKIPGASAVQVIDAILGYLPYISGLSTCLDTDELIWKSDPIFHWRPSLTSYISQPPLLPFPSIHSEHLFVLLCYTLSLSNYAHSILSTLPTPTDHISIDETKRITAGLTRAVDLLCQAAGIAEWTAEVICPQVESVRNASGRLGKYRWPVETGSEAFRGLAMTLVADAHITAIRKLLLPVLPHMMFAPPGPPLPSNHPSPSLLAKLYLHVSQLYTSASGLLRSHTATKGVDEGVDGEIIPELKRYLRKESLLASALAYKWLGVDAGENSKGVKIGEAVCWMKESQGRLEELEDGKVREKMKGLSFGRGSDKKKEERKARRGRVERELEDVQAWLKSYVRMNDTVSFQPVPAITSLTVPSGRPIFAAKPFKPPASKMVQETKETGADEYAGKGSYY